MEVVTISAVRIVLGIVCATIAQSRGRSAAAWFFIGFLAGCIGLIVLLVLPDLAVEEARVQRLEAQNRRLRERLNVDRQVADRRHAEAQRRLAVHDEALGVDTAPELRGGSPPEVPPLAAAADGAHVFEQKQWYYAEGSTQSEPVDFAGLRRRWREGQIGAATLVWSDGMDGWQALGAVPGLEERLRA